VNYSDLGYSEMYSRLKIVFNSLKVLKESKQYSVFDKQKTFSNKMSIKRDFSGKVVVITGSSSGIGAGAAQEFSRAGAQVVINGRNVKNLSEVGKQCLKVSPKGMKPLEVVADVSNEEDCKRLIDSTINAFGKLDVLVNNAGIAAINF